MTIEIHRIIKEISPLQALEQSVIEAEARVADWKRSVAAIETELNTANAALVRAKGHREAHAMAARLGDATAKAVVAQARDEQHAAEQDIVDLQIALPAAAEQLATAEKSAASARHALAKLQAEALMRQRIEVAGQIDEVIAEFTRLFGQYEKFGREIANMPGILPANTFGMVNHDDALGWRRVRACLPKLLDRVYPNAQHDEMRKESLATSETRHWNLPPIESETKAA
jgi:DNA repair exonuclease SbcCD ATPase subunit